MSHRGAGFEQKKEQQTSGYSLAKDQCNPLCTVIILLLMMLTLSEQLHCV